PGSRCRRRPRRPVLGSTRGAGDRPHELRRVPAREVRVPPPQRGLAQLLAHVGVLRAHPRSLLPAEGCGCSIVVLTTPLLLVRGGGVVVHVASEARVTVV